MSELKGRGGSGRGQGRKPLAAAKTISLKLMDDELQKYVEDPLGSSTLIRFLIRKHYKLCLHGILVVDQMTGATTCYECHADSPEDFSKLHRNLPPEDEQILDFPPI
jgi:hypothetical protein